MKTFSSSRSPSPPRLEIIPPYNGHVIQRRQLSRMTSSPPPPNLSPPHHPPVRMTKLKLFMDLVPCSEGPSLPKLEKCSSSGPDVIAPYYHSLWTRSKSRASSPPPPLLSPPYYPPMWTDAVAKLTPLWEWSVTRVQQDDWKRIVLKRHWTPEIHEMWRITINEGLSSEDLQEIVGAGMLTASTYSSPNCLPASRPLSIPFLAPLEIELEEGIGPIIPVEAAQAAEESKRQKIPNGIKSGLGGTKVSCPVRPKKNAPSNPFHHAEMENQTQFYRDYFWRHHNSQPVNLDHYTIPKQKGQRRGVYFNPMDNSDKVIKLRYPSYSTQKEIRLRSGYMHTEQLCLPLPDPETTKLWRELVAERRAGVKRLEPPTVQDQNPTSCPTIPCSTTFPSFEDFLGNTSPVPEWLETMQLAWMPSQPKIIGADLAGLDYNYVHDHTRARSNNDLFLVDLGKNIDSSPSSAQVYVDDDSDDDDDSSVDLDILITTVGRKEFLQMPSPFTPCRF